MKADYPTREQTEGLCRLWQEAFGDGDTFLDAFWSTAFSSDRCRCITVDGEVAAALYWFDCRCAGKPMAYLYAVATRKKHRGKGLCRTLMEDTHALLKDLGYAGCILVPGGPELFSMYGKMGYACFGGMDTISCTAGQPVNLREITAEEYAWLRKAYLPQRGVVQEGLAFLENFAQFYAGSDFILATTEELGLELLGNTAAAPGILGALEKRAGVFRIPGGAHFAMYLPLSDAPAPSYFGLAFD